MTRCIVVAALTAGLFAMWAAPLEAQDTASTQAAAATTVFHMVTSGIEADVAWSDALSSQVLQTFGTTQGRGTNSLSDVFIVYNALAFDPSSEVCTDDPLLGSFCHFTRTIGDFAAALINPNDFAITANAARLETDLSQATGFLFNHCVQDEVAGTIVCTDTPPSGLINLVWKRTKLSSERAMGTTESTLGPETLRVTGSRVSFSAIANGTILGKLVQDRPALIGTTQSVAIDILRTH